MSCDRYRKALGGVAAGGDVTSEVEGHLRECEACRGELDALRKALALADADMVELLASEPSPDLPSRIRRAAAADPARRWRAGRPALAAAAILLIAFGAVAVWRMASGPDRPESPAQPRLSARTEAASRGPRSASEPRAKAVPATEAEPSPGRTPLDRLPAAVEPPRSEAPPAFTGGSFAAEVLVPASQEEALALFAADLQGRAVTPDSLLVAERDAPLNEPRPLHRVEIEALTLGSAAVSEF